MTIAIVTDPLSLRSWWHDAAKNSGRIAVPVTFWDGDGSKAEVDRLVPEKMLSSQLRRELGIGMISKIPIHSGSAYATSTWDRVFKNISLEVDSKIFKNEGRLVKAVISFDMYRSFKAETLAEITALDRLFDLWEKYAFAVPGCAERMTISTMFSAKSINIRIHGHADLPQDPFEKPYKDFSIEAERLCEDGTLANWFSRARGRGQRSKIIIHFNENVWFGEDAPARKAYIKQCSMCDNEDNCKVN